ncbi:four helix bundle protein [Anaerolineae bacterium CFX7]|nr:four helix bundle protein [Anaerolineae bacterium CFX7]
MATVTRFEELEAWQTAREITKRIYALSKQSLFSRDFGLRDQMRRAAVSILSNIAEGFESRTQLMFIEYLGRAKASAGELRAQMYVALDSGYVEQSSFQEIKLLIEKCSRQISRLMSYLESLPDNRRLRDEMTEYKVELE